MIKWKTAQLMATAKAVNQNRKLFVFAVSSIPCRRAVFYFVSSSNFERVQILHGCNFYTSYILLLVTHSLLVNIFDGSISLTTLFFPGSYSVRTFTTYEIFSLTRFLLGLICSIASGLIYLKSVWISVWSTPFKPL